MENQIRECVEKHVGKNKIIPIFWMMEDSKVILPPMKVNFGFKSPTKKEIEIFYKKVHSEENEEYWLGLGNLVDDKKANKSAFLRLHSSNGEAVEEWRLLGNVQAYCISWYNDSDAPYIDIQLTVNYELVEHVSFNSNSSSETTDTSRTSNQPLSTNDNPFRKFLPSEDVGQEDSSNQ